MKLRDCVLALSACLLPHAAWAHVVLGQTSGFIHGLSHPLSGVDHVLAMVMVGVFAYQLGGRALWLVPASFVGLMAVGGALGMAGVGLPYAELGIAASLCILGACVAAGIELPVAAAMGLVGVFAMFHGHAHGAEMPHNSGGIVYAAGFVIATAILHISGIGGAYAIKLCGMKRSDLVVRASGGVVVMVGIGLLFNMI